MTAGKPVSTRQVDVPDVLSALSARPIDAYDSRAGTERVMRMDPAGLPEDRRSGSGGSARPPSPAATVELVGRSVESSYLGGVLDGIGSGGGAVQVRGDAGIGKSELLRWAAGRAASAGCRMLSTTGLEAVAATPFSGLSDLLEPLLSRADALHPVQRRALLTALGRLAGPPPQLFLVALAVLTLLTEAAATRPIVLVVDDLQWLDGPTTDVLAFLGRRLADDPVVLLSAERTEPRAAGSAVDIEVLDLQGLDEVSAQLLLDSRPTLSPGDRSAILETARGNPLALVELPAGWTPDDPATGHEPAAGPLSGRLERAFGRSIAALPRITRDALLVAALSRGADLAVVLAGASVLAGAPLTAAVLEPAEAAGVVRFDFSDVRFRHPLVRSSVVLHESPARRQQANAALAAVFHDQPGRRTWHLAQAVDGPDDEVAQALQRDAELSVARGALLTGIAGLERAAQLTSDAGRRGQRLLLAAHHAYGLGRADLVDRLVTAAARTPLTELDQARAQWLREIFDDGDPGDADRVMALCDTAAAAQIAGDGELAMNLVLSAAGRCWWADTGRRARAAVVAAADALTDFDHDPRCIAALAVAEPVLLGDEVMRRLSGFGPETVADADQLRLLGMAARAVGDETRAAEFLDRAETALRTSGRLGHLSHVLTLQGAVQVDLGDWQRAAGSAGEAYQLGVETGQPVWALGTAVLQARVSALRGSVAEALDRAALVDRSPVLRRANQILACAQLARGIAWICADRHADAYAALRPMFDPADARHHQREQLGAIMYLAEAAVRCGRRDDALLILSRMEAVAALTTSPLLAMQLLYARAVLAEDDRAEALYRRALSHDLTRWPWIRARLQLAYGGWLRRQRRDAESREPLRLALATFSLIGATSWGAQARVELRSAGERSQPSARTLSAELSPQELQVVRLAAQGLSNKEIGARLFLSPRTIASHLYRIFPRLGIRSRGQLALLFGDASAGGPVPTSARRVEQGCR